jgi:DNA-binding response OmpR family regulator/HPt (histidine-containing phosphotransfer) domain-containing protein
MADRVRVLVVDDNPGDARLVGLTLDAEAPDRYRVERAGSIAEALPRLDAGDVAAVLLDLGLPDSQGTDGLRRIRARSPATAVLVLSGAEDARVAARAFQDGAQDYQIKGIFPPGELDRRIRAAIAAEAIQLGLRHAPAIGREGLRLLGEAGEGAALLLGPGEADENDRFRELAGGPAALSTPETAWLTALLRELDEAGPAAIHGWISRDDGGISEPLEYQLRRVDPPPAVLVRLHRRAAARTPFSPVPGENPTAALDSGVLAQLAELGGGNAAFVSGLLATFRREADRTIRRLQAEGDSLHLARAARDAHTLKSAAAQVGAFRLSRLALDLERRAKAEDGTGARALVHELAAEFARVEADPRMGRPPPEG